MNKNRAGATVRQTYGERRIGVERRICVERADNWAGVGNWPEAGYWADYGLSVAMENMDKNVR